MLDKAWIDDCMELLSRSEEVLNPVLARYYSEEPFPMIQHPLVYSVPHASQMNGFVNEQYKAKKNAVEQAYRDKDWNKYIVLHERPHRLQALIDVYGFMSPQEYWKTLGWIWTDSENIRQNQAIWNVMLNKNIPSRECFMSEGDREQHDLLPSEFKIYRGCWVNDIGGLSWTKNLQKAKWFAKRNADLHNQETEVRVMTIRLEHAIGYIQGRGEAEIVLHPQFSNLRYEVIK